MLTDSRPASPRTRGFDRGPARSDEPEPSAQKHDHSQWSRPARAGAGAVQGLPHRAGRLASTTTLFRPVRLGAGSRPRSLVLLDDDLLPPGLQQSGQLGGVVGRPQVLHDSAHTCSLTATRAPVAPKAALTLLRYGLTHYSAAVHESGPELPARPGQAHLGRNSHDEENTDDDDQARAGHEQNVKIPRCCDGDHDQDRGKKIRVPFAHFCRRRIVCRRLSMDCAGGCEFSSVVMIFS